MRRRLLKNRLLTLLQDHERSIGRRVKLKDVQTCVGITNHTITSWIRNEVTRYDAHIVEGFCEYFNCDVGDLLYFEWVEQDETPATSP